MFFLKPYYGVFWKREYCSVYCWFPNRNLHYALLLFFLKSPTSVKLSGVKLCGVNCFYKLLAIGRPIDYRILYEMSVLSTFMCNARTLFVFSLHTSWTIIDVSTHRFPTKWVNPPGMVWFTSTPKCFSWQLKIFHVWKSMKE